MALHRLLALMFLVSLYLGWALTGLSLPPTRLKFYNGLKWAGMTFLMLSALRLL